MRWGLLVLCCMGLVRSGVAQQNPKLEVKVFPVAARARCHGPVRVVLRVGWSGKRLLQGCFDLTVRDENDVYCRVRTGEVTLATGFQSLDVVLPAMESTMADGKAEVHVRFLGKKQNRDIGKFSIVLADRTHRSLVIGICRAAGTVSTHLLNIGRSLSLERYDPLRAEVETRDILTSTAWLVPEDFPTNPLDTCSFDLLLVDGFGLARLQRKQVNALLTWVEGGGSLCLLAGELSGLKPYHVQFLDNLAGGEGTAYILDREGDVLREGAAPDGFSCYCAELGRAVVVHRALDPAADLETPGWRRVVGFLWKVRFWQQKKLIRSGSWKEVAPPAEGIRRTGWSRPILQLVSTYALCPLSLDLKPFVVPPEIQLIPLWVLILILALFLLAIGPLDYLLLGLLRRRWLTWILFPLVCIAFTLLTVKVSNVYLGESDFRKSLVFVDVGKGGKVLRKSTFEFLFSAGESVRVRNLSRTLFTPVDTDRFSRSRTTEIRWDSPIRRDSLPWMEGWVSGSVEVRQKIWKWTPLANRLMQFGKGETVSDLDWDAVDLETLFRDEKESISSVRSLLFKETPDREKYFLVFVCHRDTVEKVVTPGSETSVDPMRPDDITTLISQVSARSSESGWSGVVSRISPAGGGTFEDLAVLDSANRNEYLLVAVAREGNDLIVYRRLYTCTPHKE